MANKYVIAGALVIIGVAFVGSNLWSYRHGQEVEKGRAAVLMAKANDAAILAARSNGIQEEQERGALALAQQKADAKSREAKLKGQIHAIKQNRPECLRNADDMRMLNDAIEAANR